MPAVREHIADACAAGQAGGRLLAEVVIVEFWLHAIEMLRQLLGHFFAVLARLYGFVKPEAELGHPVCLRTASAYPQEGHDH